MYQFSYLSRVTYEDGLKAQEKALELLEKSPASLGMVLGLEHPSVITLGKRGRESEDLNAHALELSKKGVELKISSRGGQATLHSPGQLVIYPCVHLNRMGIGVRDYVCGLEKSTKSFLTELGIETLESCGDPGVYTPKGKIAFFGVRVSKGMASHGLAINVANDLELFGLIRSCGRTGESFDRILDYAGLAPNKQALPELFLSWQKHFLQAFT